MDIIFKIRIFNCFFRLFCEVTVRGRRVNCIFVCDGQTRGFFGIFLFEYVSNLIILSNLKL